MIYNGPMRFAHRGVAQKAPENTEGAFQAAVDEGYEGIELDIRLSKDGEAIVCHDSHFARLTCGHPAKYCIRHLADMTWEELARIELPYALHLLPEELPPYTENESLATVPWTLLGDYEAAYRTEPRMARLMRFLDFDRWLSRQTRKITVEVEFCAPGLMPRMLEILDASPNKEQYILFSGHRELIDDMQNTCRCLGKPAGVRLGANIRQLTPEAKKYIDGLDLFEIGLNDRRYTQEDVKVLNDRGIEVFSNLGDYPAWWEEMCRTGALGFKTNYAAAFTRWWETQHPSSDAV